MSPENANNIEQNLANWKNSLFPNITVADLISRNPVAYKWKAPFRSWMLREAVLWRQHDLMTQSYLLYQKEHILGARILLRSGFETLATLIYLNQQTQKVLDGKLCFHCWGKKTNALLLGTRNNPKMPNSINILTILEKCDKRYLGLKKLYADLSESAHPSYEGLCKGYSKLNKREFEATFSNRWMELFGKQHLSLMNLCMETFHQEYNDVWIELTERLECWIESNDSKLEDSIS